MAEVMTDWLTLFFGLTGVGAVFCVVAKFLRGARNGGFR